MTEEQFRKGGAILRSIGATNDRIRELQELIDKGNLIIDVRSRGGVSYMTLHVETLVIEALICANIDEERQRLEELQEEFDNL